MDKPILRYDLHQKVWLGLTEISPTKYGSLDEMLSIILGEKVQEYYNGIPCATCWKTDGSCQGCPLDWGVPVSETKCPCLAVNSPLSEYNRLATVYRAQFMSPIRFKQLLAPIVKKIANLPLNENAKNFHVVMPQ